MTDPQQESSSSHNAGETDADDAGETDADDAAAAHAADRPPTAQEEAAAEGNELKPSVDDHYREMAETGTEVRGEGEITPS